jgi:phosphoesterase RecJ-like protein
LTEPFPIPFTGDPISQVLPSLNDGKPIYIVTHERPDGDAIGSQTALTRYLRNLRLPAFALCTDDKISETLRSCLNNVPQCSLSKFTPNSHRVAVDAGETSRVAEALRGYPFELVIDHHPETEFGKTFGTYRLIQSHQSSACEVLMDLLEKHGYTFDDPIVNDALYLGLIGDTGNFCNTNTHADTFRHAEHLARAGVRPHTLVQRLYKSQTLQQFRLYEIFLNRVRLYADGAIVFSTLTEADYEATHTNRTDTEGFVNRLLLLKTAKIAAFTEQTSALVKVSLRSVDTAYPVNTVAQRLGGGGHVCAASFKCKPGAFSEEALVEHLRKLL